MTTSAWTVAAALAAGLGMAGTAAAQPAQAVNPTNMPPGSRAGAAPGMGGVQTPGTPAIAVNPTNMPPGSQAGAAPGMGGTAGAGAPAQAVNPTNMPPGSVAGTAPGMQPGPQPLPGQPRVVEGMGRVGGTGIHAPDAQPDIVPGTLRPGSPVGQSADAPTAAPAAPAPATGAATPGVPAAGGGRTTIEAGPRVTRGVGADEQISGTLESGANSFTAEQAAERMARAGFSDVQELRLDDRGIWHGRAMRGGAPTGVAMDFRGNVVPTR